MDDRELLERAAKAADIKVPEEGPWGGIRADWGVYELNEDGTSFERSWNPLRDDGAALRLAVKLGIQITPGTYLTQDAVAYMPGSMEVKEHVSYQQDMLAATRRAIVRAAAGIGTAI